MAKLNHLIKGQDVSFDTHQAGDGQEIHWQELHLEKTIHGGLGAIKFPLFGAREPKLPEGMTKARFNSVRSEVKRALKKNERLVRDLAETIADQMNRYSSGRAGESYAEEVARKVANSFDLDEEFIVIARNHIANRLSSYVTLHVDRADGFLYEIRQSRRGVSVGALRVKSFSG